MENKSEKVCGDLKVIEKKNYQFGVEDLNGNIIVPYGQYAWIDEFVRGYARVKNTIGNCWARIKLTEEDEKLDSYTYPKWGIINTNGELVVPLEYDEIWRLKDGYDRMVMYKKSKEEAARDAEVEAVKVYGGKPKPGSVYFDVRDGLIYPSQESCANLFANAREIDSLDNDSNDCHYDEFAGSYAQDVMGYSDEDIYDAFDGDPEAYWNID